MGGDETGGIGSLFEQSSYPKPYKSSLAYSNLTILTCYCCCRPGVGKTTAIREISRTLADELKKRVVVVDTSNEIGGDGDVPHDGIGRARRMQVHSSDEQCSFCAACLRSTVLPLLSHGLGLGLICLVILCSSHTFTSQFLICGWP